VHGRFWKLVLDVHQPSVEAEDARQARELRGEEQRGRVVGKKGLAQGSTLVPLGY
jgi:hypothetical protein